jgi:hypothetical protein
MGSPEANATAPTPGAWSDTDLLAKLRHMFWSGRVHVHFDVTRYTKAHDQIAEPGGVSIGAAWLVVFVINGLVLFYILAMVGSKIAWLAPVYHFAERHILGHHMPRVPKAIIGALVGGAFALARRHRYMHDPGVWNALWARGYLTISLCSNPAVKCISPSCDWRAFISCALAESGS